MRTMVFAAVALLLTTACTIAPEKAKPGWAGATSGEQYERLFWDSVKAKNWRDVEAHLSGTVVTETPDAVRNKQQTMEHVRQLNLTDYSLGDLQTQSNGPDLIVTYTITVHGTFNGQPIPDKPQRMMSVWQVVGKGTVITAHTSMPSAP
jgi:hypothetical protein